MSLPIRTSGITLAVTSELAKLPRDKRLHAMASYGLCLSSPALNPDEHVSTAIGLVFSLLHSFKAGIKKEYDDAGKDPAPAMLAMEAAIDEMEILYLDYKGSGINKLKHETDLLADVVGASMYTLNRGLMALQYHRSDDESDG